MKLLYDTRTLKIYNNILVEFKMSICMHNCNYKKKKNKIIVLFIQNSFPAHDTGINFTTETR